jgi:hypothetical protein
MEGDPWREGLMLNPKKLLKFKFGLKIWKLLSQYPNNAKGHDGYFF